jgi:hypothetical protein
MQAQLDNDDVIITPWLCVLSIGIDVSHASTTRFSRNHRIELR